MDARTSRYHDEYERWRRDPDGFWAEAARDIDWYEQPRRIFDPAAGSPTLSSTPAGTRSIAM